MEGQEVSELFERQVRRWHIDGRAGMPQPRGAVVSVSHTLASGGDEVARLVAEWLDYGLFGLDAIRQIAGDPTLRKRLATELAPGDLEAIEARVRRLFGDAEDGLEALARVVATLGERGMAVVIGRGASAVLAPERTLRALVVAPRGVRIERLAAARGLTTAEAEREVDRDDAARVEFLRTRLGVAGDDPTLYDLVLNTGELPVAAAAALIVEALRRRFPPGKAR